MAGPGRVTPINNDNVIEPSFRHAEAAPGRRRLGTVAMPLTAAHYLRRAEEVRTTAKLCRDPKLRGMLREIAKTYDDLAKEERLHDCGSDYRRRGATRQA